MPQTFVFRVPLEEPPVPLGQLVARAWPEGTSAQIDSLFELGRIRVDERPVKDASKVPASELVCEFDAPVGEELFGIPEAGEMARGDGWVVVNKPDGIPALLDRDDPMNPVLFLADTLGADRDTFTPVWTMDTTMGGPWLCALEQPTAIELRKDCAAGNLMTTWTAICPAPEKPVGSWNYDGIRIQFAATQMRNGLAELQLTPHFDGNSRDPVPFLQEALEAQGHPIVGSRSHGGHLAAGGLRLRLTALVHTNGDLAHSWLPDPAWWPDQPVVPAPEETPQRPRKATADSKFKIATLQVSQTTLDVIEKKGHPWVLADSDTGDRRHFKPGSLVRLVSKNGRSGPFALIEGNQDLAARVWGWEEEAASDFQDEIAIRLDEAFARRGKLFETLATTDVFRLVHAEADGLPALYLDRCGPIIRATLAGGAAMGMRKVVYDNISDSDPRMAVVEVRHLTDIRANSDELPKAKIVKRGAGYIRAGERIVVREHGLLYWADPWEGIDIGFFADQRDNRRILLDTVQPGESWLNLFCHTGAFTVALASVGASVTSVDVSARYLEWLDQNMVLNGLEPQTNAAQDARAFLDGDASKYDGIIVDPPTAARGSTGFWSVRKDYGAHLVQCFKHLNPGGQMLVCRNDRKRTQSLDDLIQEAAKSAGTKVKSLRPAPPAMDFPSQKGFPESIKFEAFWVQT